MEWVEFVEMDKFLYFCDFSIDFIAVLNGTKLFFTFKSEICCLQRFLLQKITTISKSGHRV